MSKFIWIIIVLAVGALLPIQAGVNAKLGKTLDNTVYASMFSFLVGMLVLLLYIFVTKQPVNLTGLKEAPAYIWTGGVIGAIYVTTSILAFRVLGPGLTFGLIVAGQMLVSVLLDHYKVLVSVQNPISLAKVVGVILIVAGVFLLRK